MIEKNEKEVRKEVEECPMCGRENTYAYWGGKSKYGAPNSFYLCHRCGFFYREYEGEAMDIIGGITFDPKKIPLKQQVSAIRKHRAYFNGLVIRDHFDYRAKRK